MTLGHDANVGSDCEDATSGQATLAEVLDKCAGDASACDAVADSAPSLPSSCFVWTIRSFATALGDAASIVMSTKRWYASLAGAASAV